MQEVFDYKEWRNFEKTIEKAAISIENTSESVELHFAEVSKSYNLPNEHSINNQGIRKLMIQRGIVPENLPVAEDVKKVKRRLKSESKKLVDKKKN